MAIAVVLLIHWLGMHWIVTWFGDEDALVQGQSVSSTSSENVVNDGWRRTAHGWEFVAEQSSATPPQSSSNQTMPTVHIAPAHIWPAAAAACMILLIAGLPDKKKA